ncbi:MAG: hypothetical protein IT548_06685 [Alphaproteobacteria bacterium]|nr:hypothetical protein [Alphaproteobacteria bacterium]
MSSTARTASAFTGAVDDAADTAADEAKTFTDRMTDAVSDGVSSATDYVADGIHAMTDQAPKVGAWIDDQIARASDMVREKPVQTLAIVAGVAALVGAVFARR